MVRTHGSLMHDEELNSAAWVAARGAAVGAAKVLSRPHLFLFCPINADSRYSGDCSARWQQGSDCCIARCIGA